MTRDQFLIPAKKLLAVFGGDKMYPIERLEAFYSEIGNQDAQTWAAAVERLVKEESRPPMMKEIRTAMAAERERRHEREKVQRTEELEKLAYSRHVPEELRKQFPHIFKSVSKIEGVES